jgi:hypothetical protein
MNKDWKIDFKKMRDFSVKNSKGTDLYTNCLLHIQSFLDDQKKEIIVWAEKQKVPYSIAFGDELKGYRRVLEDLTSFLNKKI